VTVIDRLRRPEYTGENRCRPCTVVNVVVAAALAVAVASTSAVAGATGPVGWAAGALVFALAAAMIYLRGYLVPGTPQLTERYFPDRVLAAFGKAPTADQPIRSPDGGRPPEEAAFDVEEKLLELRAVTECEDSPDLCLTSHFQTAWREKIALIRTGDEDNPGDLAVDVAMIVGENPESLAIEAFGEGYVARIDGRRVGQWPSEAALLGDVTAANAIIDRQSDAWGEFSVDQRGRLLQGLRVFLEQCPACDGDVVLGEEVVESCCRSVDVVAATCTDCGDRIVEIEQ
jgi:hypothetical protein